MTTLRHTSRSGSSSAFAALVMAFVSLLVPTRARAQVVETRLRATVFHEPSPTSKMTVLTPSAQLEVSPWEFLSVNAGYEADIVSGASEAVKAGPSSPPDVVSAASVHDLRHVVNGGLTITRKHTHLGASYAYGTERDYRSNSFTVNAGSDFFQKNTQIELSYGRGFDKVCNVKYADTLSPTLRPRLDSSKGCFAGAKTRRLMPIDLDSFQIGWTQSWTPLFTTQLVFSGQLQHGFLSNAYRSVVISAAGSAAQEHHPDNRARTAAAIRAKYYVKPLATAFGIDARIYRDTWDILSQTYEINAERYMLPWLRLMLRGRFYTQTGALFWSDDYTGGEPITGPRGQYWSGDRELSPLQNFLGGGRLIATWNGHKGDRIAGMLLSVSTEATLDVIKTKLDQFTWAGRAPDDTFAIVGGLGIDGQF